MSLKKINIAIVGATGYVGLDLVLLLSKHSRVRIKYLPAKKNVGKSINFYDKRITKKLPVICDFKKINWHQVDLLFLSLPSGESQKMINTIYKYKHLKFIDLSADFRIQNPKSFKKWYNINHKANKLIKDSIYAISEFQIKELSKYRIISNPGCYPTSIQITLIPLLKKKLINKKNIIIDSKSGYSGAGKNFKKKFNHKNILSAIHGYGVIKHRHMSELDQEFSKIDKQISYTFSPHLIPTFRGILTTIHIELKPNISVKKIHSFLKKKYKNSKFVKILNINSELGTGNVINTNNCEISICKTRLNNRVIIFSTIDNLIKGASGQAVQNMNLLYGFKETEALL